MTSIHRTALVLASALLTGTLACGGASAPSPGDDTSSSGLSGSSGSSGGSGGSGGGAQVCDASPPPNARCAEACPYGFAGPSGTYTCECCAAPAGSDAGSDAGEVCGGPPPNARCMACPGGATGYKQIDGKPTCECCSS